MPPPPPPPPPPAAIQTAAPVTVSLHDLRAGTVPLSTLVAAFGPDSLGILVVTDLPAVFAPLRTQVLGNASRLAALPPQKLQQLTNPRAKYLVGWSHGVEMLKPGLVDTAKGSFYINCAFYTDRAAANTNNNPATGGVDIDTDIDIDIDTPPATAAAAATTTTTTTTAVTAPPSGFEEYTAPSIWPDESDVPGFRQSAEQLIRLVIDTAVLVARACDRYGEREIHGYPAGGYLENVVRTSTTTKARLLHYFPNDVAAGAGATADDDNTTATATTTTTSSDQDTWCATHVDHGCLTGLTSAMFLDESGEGEEIPPPSPTAGLYIRSRTGQTYKVAIPRDGLAFQTGQALELMTRGRFKAVPHFVRGVDPPAAAAAAAATSSSSSSSSADNNNDAHPLPPPPPHTRIARNTLAVFTQPNLDQVVDVVSQTTFGEFARGVVRKNTVAV